MPSYLTTCISHHNCTDDTCPDDYDGFTVIERADPSMGDFKHIKRSWRQSIRHSLLIIIVHYAHASQLPAGMMTEVSQGVFFVTYSGTGTVLSYCTGAVFFEFLNIYFFENPKILKSRRNILCAGDYKTFLTFFHLLMMTRYRYGTSTVPVRRRENARKWNHCSSAVIYRYKWTVLTH